MVFVRNTVWCGFMIVCVAMLAVVGREARADGPCAKPLIDKIACCTWGVTNQLTSASESYYPVYREFAANVGAKVQDDLTSAQAKSVLEKATAFAKGAHARLPFVEPFDPSDLPSGSSVSVVSGWYYGFSGSSPGTTTGGDADHGHGGIDYVRGPLKSGENPSYKVHAVAPGQVIFADWTELSGNVIVIAHTAPDGTSYRSMYMHLRNGAKHDLAKALLATLTKLPSGKPDMTVRVTRYRVYADAQKKIADQNGGTPKQLYWGTESQKLQVKVGDTVDAGQFLAWTGDTGDGGAGDALDPGNPGQFYSGSQATGNNHLHLYFAVKHPDPAQTNHWILVDPYGIYNEASSCYADIMSERDYPLFYAPFHSSFNGVRLDIFSRYFSYYPGMGRALQTLSIHDRSGTWLASGSFQAGLPSQWKAGFFETETQYEASKKQFDKDGMRPRQVSINVLSGGELRYTTLWQAQKAGEKIHLFTKLSDKEMSEKWDTYIKNGHFRIEDHFGYTINGAAFHAAIFIDDGHHDFYYPYNLGSADFKKFIDDLPKGYQPLTTDLEDFPWGRRLGGLFMPRTGTWHVKWGLSPTEYQDKYTDYAKQGFTLERVQGYNNSTEYLGVWRKVDCPNGQHLEFSGACVP